MSRTVSAFRWVPPFAQGLVRDLRVRWALNEAGLAYDENLIGFEDQGSERYRRLQPFGQVPVLQDGGLELFESGAIVLHVAERSAALMPDDADARARVRTWMFAALSTVEPPIMMLNVIDLQPGGAPEGARGVRDAVVAKIEQRLDALASFLGDREHLVADRFTAADLLMVSVLRILRTTDLVARRPTLDAYRLRGEARPAFGKALAEQMAPFKANAPPPAPAA
jgi:glutathione S-transferase